MITQQLFFTVSETAKIANLDNDTILRLLNQNELNYIRFNFGLRYIPLNEVKALKHIYSKQKRYTTQKQRIQALNEYYKEFKMNLCNLKELPELLTTRDLCRLFGVSMATIYKKTSSGELPTYKFIGNKCYFKRDEIMALIQARKVQE